MLVCIEEGSSPTGKTLTPQRNGLTLELLLMAGVCWPFDLQRARGQDGSEGRSCFCVEVSTNRFFSAVFQSVSVLFSG